ncbi:hypothetical protein [Snodgrassella alvi]|jgi:NAD(P)-dependent dehydrogenase (short-subunit alcohol dehydrogenase family)|uniref:Uncharacterized protein n=1 Tax=Snodgrassella alvi TaxID=1196083 RepID=A0A855FT17_9NEIS|nr:hypothetical protein [Snodgrassella alvi]PIT58885.1 hypothetical protein BHC57_10915 [Snodgrassella alvi]
MKGLEDKYAHITGDSSGVGLEMARELIAESANAAFTDKNRLLEAKKRVRWRYINFLMRCV